MYLANITIAKLLHLLFWVYHNVIIACYIK